MQLFTHLLSSYLQGMGDFFSALPGADGEVDTATHGGRQFVTLLGIVVGVPHSSGPRQSTLGIDAPGMGAQLLVAVARGRGHGVLGLRLDTRDGEHHEP